MSSENRQQSHFGRTVSIVAALVFAYLLLPPVAVTLLIRTYGGLEHIPSKAQTALDVMFVPADWLWARSETYQTVIAHEHRLLGN